LRTPLPILAALAALAPASAASAEADPARETLVALKGACDRAGVMEEMKADAVKAGWEPMAEDADPRIAKLTKLGRQAAEADGNLSGATYRRTLAGRELFLVLSRYDDKATRFWGAGCRVYDFAATQPFDPRVLEAFMGRAPTGVETPAPGLSRRLWEPGWRSGITVEASYVPAGHPFGEAFGVTGVVLIAQAIGGF
jgi:hypothetical protein